MRGGGNRLSDLHASRHRRNLLFQHAKSYEPCKGKVTIFAVPSMKKGVINAVGEKKGEINSKSSQTYYVQAEGNCCWIFSPWYEIFISFFFFIMNIMNGFYYRTHGAGFEQKIRSSNSFKALEIKPKSYRSVDYC